MLRKLMIIGAVAVGLLSLTSGLAQSAVTPFVNYFQTIEGGDAFRLDVYFNMVDSGGSVVTTAEVESVSLTLDDGSVYEPVPAVRPDSPFYITLVLDASGSMTAANGTMRQAAIQAINTAPDRAQFSVISFSDEIQTVQTFTTDKALAAQQADTIRSKPNGGTCLYDATFQAIQGLASQPRGQRAVIVFTDGQDRLIASDPTPCSTQTLDGVINLANNPDLRVPVHVVGLEANPGDINTSELTRMASGTGGFFRAGNQGNLTALFDEIMIALSNQWLAQIEMYPPTGDRIGVMTPTLSDGTIAGSTEIRFRVTGTYAPPLQLISENLRRDESGNITFNLSGIGLERVATLRFRLIDAETNLEVGTPFDFTGVPPSVTLPGSTMVSGKNYVVLASGTDPSGRALPLESFGLGFKYEAEAEIVEDVRVAIASLERNDSANTLIANLVLGGASRIARIEATVEDRTGVRVPNLISQNTGAPTAIQIDTSSLQPDTDYRIAVMPYGVNGQPLMPEPMRYDFRTPPQVLPAITISGITPDREADQFIIDLQATNADQIQRIEVALFDGNQFRVGEPREITGVPSQFPIPIGDLATDQYRLEISIVDPPQPNVIIEPYEFDYTAPRPSFGQRIVNFLSNPIVLAFIFALIALVAGFIVRQTMISRQPKAANDPSNPASQVTTYYERNPEITLPTKHSVPNRQRFNDMTAERLPVAPPQAKSTSSTAHPPSNTPARPPSNTPASPPHGVDIRNEPTGGVTQILRPTQQARIRVIQSKTYEGQDKVETIDASLYRVGRNDTNQLAFGGDKSVSGSHLTLQYDTESERYVLFDMGSSYGTKVNGETLRPNQPHFIGLGETVKLDLGHTVILEIEVIEG